MQILTDRTKGKQIYMHDRETEIGRQMRREAKREANSMTSHGLVCVRMHVLKVDVSVLERVLCRREG